MKRLKSLSLSVIGVVLLGAGLSQVAEATVPGQNGKIMLESNVSGAVKLFTVDPRGGPLTQISSGSESSYDASFSPDGTRIVYVRNNPDDQLWTKPSSGSGGQEVPLTDNSDFDSNYPGAPVYAPNGESIVYNVAEIFGGPGEVPPVEELRKISVEGGDAAPLGQWASFSLNPDISPDGSRIAIVDAGGSESVIRILTIGGTVVSTLPTAGLAADNPTYSADGSRIAFTGTAGGIRQIFSIGADGTGLDQLTSDPTEKRRPVYSPDGTAIAYSDASGGAIFAMEADGSNPHEVASTPAFDTMADWQRKTPFLVRKVNPFKRTVQTRIFGPGRLTVFGKSVRRSSKMAKSSGMKSVALRLKSSTKRRLVKRGQARFPVSIRFAPKGALSTTRKTIVRLRTR